MGVVAIKWVWSTIVLVLILEKLVPMKVGLKSSVEERGWSGGAERERRGEGRQGEGGGSRRKVTRGE